MKVLPTKENMKIMGRCVRSGDMYCLGHAGSFAEFRVDASYVDVTLDTVLDTDTPELQVYLGVFADGVQIMRFSPKPGLHTYRVFAAPEKRAVTLRLFKLTESAYGSIGLRELDTDSEHILPTAAKERRIEFVGDSITCGYGAEQEENDVFSTSGENAFQAYAVQTALALDADCHIVAKSGIGIYSGYIDPEVNEPNRADQMPQVYPYTDLFTSRTRGLSPEKWEPGSFDPQLIVVNLGTNDNSYVRGKPERTAEFTAALRDFLGEVIQLHPGAQLLYVFGMMECALGDVIDREIRGLQADEPRLHLLRLPTPKEGFALSGHPSPQMHRAAAEAVTLHIRALMGW